MKQRCENPKNPSFKDYGLRGIEVRFRDVDELIDHIGLPPRGYCIDRINNDGHYEKGNVRWTDWSTSNSNRRRWAGRRAKNFTEEQVLAIVGLAQQGLSQAAIAQMFRARRRTINKILNGHNWSWLTGITPRKKTVSS